MISRIAFDHSRKSRVKLNRRWKHDCSDAPCILMRQRSREGSNARDGIPHVRYNDIESISRSSAARTSRKLRDGEEILSLFFPIVLISGFDIDYGPELSRTSPRHTKRRDREHRGTRLRAQERLESLARGWEGHHDNTCGGSSAATFRKA